MIGLFDRFLFVLVGHFLDADMLSINFLIESASSTFMLHISLSLSSSNYGLDAIGNVLSS